MSRVRVRVRVGLPRKAASLTDVMLVEEQQAKPNSKIYKFCKDPASFGCQSCHILTVQNNLALLKFLLLFEYFLVHVHALLIKLSFSQFVEKINALIFTHLLDLF